MGKRTIQKLSSRAAATILTIPILLFSAGIALGDSGSKTYTVNADFDDGSLINVSYDAFPDQLQLIDTGEAFEFIWVAASIRGTIVKIDTVTGAILGEYQSAPSGRARNPSRTTVDANGNVWAGNRDESSGGLGSVVHVGLEENGQCVDRNGNGSIETSTGLGDIKPWTNSGGADNNGGVSTAEDECIIHYVRTSGTNVRTVAVDGLNNVWVGGYANRTHELYDSAGVAVPGSQFNVGCGGYGGLFDANGVLWSANISQSRLLRYDANTKAWSCIFVPQSYGLGIDTNGNIWNSTYSNNTVWRISATGTPTGSFPTLGAAGDRGVVVTPADNNVWIANSWGNTVSRLDNNGNYLTQVTVGSTPTGVAVDAAGKVWVTNYSSDNVMRIDPATNSVDLTVSLGGGARPYNYSDMTGSTLTAPPDIGTWTVDYDSGDVNAP
jgi:YVTN family beta-propeller protein